MIIKLDRSVLFTQDPDIRFSNEFKVKRGVWKKLWRMYKNRDDGGIYRWKKQDIREWFEFKYRKALTVKTFDRWIYRTEIYLKAKELNKKKSVQVNIHEYFHKYTNFILSSMRKK